jgi:uncharacterized protein with GYD domain
MPKYLMLSTLGPDGASTLLQNPERLRAVNAEVEAMGVKVVEQFAVLGPYDFCNILEAPNEQVMARVAMTLAARGTLKTLTLTVIPVEDFIAAMRADPAGTG